MRNTFQITTIEPALEAEIVASFRDAVQEGLGRSPRGLPSRFFYDDLGSEYFRQIMELEEYYLTGAEYEILSTQAGAIARYLPDEPFNLIELGSGDGSKTVALLEGLRERHDFIYYPIDISAGAMESLQTNLGAKGSWLSFHGVVADYFSGLDWMRTASDRPSVVLFLGSNIGNFSAVRAREFLDRLRARLRPGDFFLLGADLKKDIELIERAYNDSRGVTRLFNLNLLERINRELGGNFALDGFDFHSYYNPVLGAVESFIISQRAQTVRISALGQTYLFREFESIHTEYSHKYRLDELEALARASGFAPVRHFLDSREYFVDSLWRVEKIFDQKRLPADTDTG